MSDTSPTAGWSLPPSRARAIDPICDAFESAWRAGQRPQIEQYLADAPESNRLALLRELLALDVYYRSRSEDRPSQEEYRQRFPNHSDVVQAVFAAAETWPSRDPREEDSAQESNSPDQTWLLGGRYEVQGELGRGGMGVVYKARHVQLNLLVALKMIGTGHFASQEELDRFYREAREVARLSHPHVVRIYDCGEHDNLPYFSMEYMEGGTLADKIAGNPLPPNEAAELVEILARTMQFVHEQSIVHRDLKPANVLFSARGVLKIGDFGLVKRLDQETQNTQTGAIMGTASYMAPEQAAGKTKEIGPHTDIYALGAILYEALTGRPPFRADTRELTVHQVLYEEPMRPASLRAEIPAGLEAICLKCLEKDHRQRYASAAALADDLKRFHDGEPLSIEVLDEWQQQVRWARRAGYELLEIQGASVLGMVYKARHLRLNRIVTLKTISSQTQSDPVKMARFRAEAQMAAQLQHPGIVQIYDFNAEDGQPYFSMEFVAGGTLADKFKGAPVPIHQAVVWIETLAQIVSYAHQQGMIHANLRPFEVLLTDIGALKITGFGLAELLRKEPLVTGTKGVQLEGAMTTISFSFRKETAPPGTNAVPLGLSNYMSPEQADGRTNEIGPPTDVYALGAMLCEMLTGRPPVLADTVKETLEQIRTRTPEPPSRLRPEVPAGLEAICLTCLEKEPGQRYSNADALAHDLECFRDRHRPEN